MNKRGKIFNKINTADKRYNVRKIFRLLYLIYLDPSKNKKMIKIDNGNDIPFDGNV